MLNLPSFRWLTIFCGGMGIARVIHFLTAVFLTSFVAIHIYLAVTTNLGRLKSKLDCQPSIIELDGERTDSDENDSAGGTGKPGYVR